MSVRSLLARAAAPTATVLRNRGLRRIQLALAATALTTPAYAVALSVYAYREGGIETVALVGVITFLPAGLLAPVLSVLADRGRRERVLAAALLGRGLTLAASSLCIFVDAPVLLVFTLAGLSSIASRVARPAQAAIVPSLARDDDELTAANALAATVDEVGTIVGPALAGLLLLVAGPDPVIALSAGAALAAATLARGLPKTEAPPAAEDQPFRRELAAGMTAVVRDKAIRLPVFLITLQTAAFGAVGVLMVALAIDQLALGDAGLGLLEMALGLGGIIGGVLALGVASSRRLGACLGLGMAFWGAAIALLGLYPQMAAVLLLFVAVGLSNIFVDVPGYTLIQRVTPGAVIGRVFGALEGLGVVGTAAGTALAPILVALLGLQGAFIVVGGLILGLALVSWRALQRLDASEDAADDACVGELLEQPHAV